MVGIVLVSHSRPLAMAVQELVRSMTGPGLSLAIAAGAGDNHAELGTDAVEISEAILSVKGADGVVVLMDMGSAILSSETALDLLPDTERANIHFCAAPFVEGAVAASVTANLGASLAEVCREALAGLKQKEAALPEKSPEPGETALAATPTASLRLIVTNQHGLHARPAARLIGALKSFQADVSIRNLTNQRGPVSAKSLSRLASLEILQSHEIEISASGQDADAALKKIRALAKAEFGAPPGNPSPPKSKKAAGQPLPISGGLAIGPLFRLEALQLDIPQDTISDVAAETSRLLEAVAATQRSLETRRHEMAQRVGNDQAGIYDAQILTLQDPELIDTTTRLISSDHKNAALAWSEANRQIVDRYLALQDNYLRERAADMKDIGHQVLEKLVPGSAAAPVMTTPSILVADDLTPNQVSGLSKDLVLGVVLLDGGPTAHSSILLKALGLPAVIQARGLFTNCKFSDPREIAFDGSTGDFWLDAAPALLQELKIRQAAQRKQLAEEKNATVKPATTLDGHRVHIFANIGRTSEAASAVSLGAEGVGLLRTEFLFLDRTTAPSENEQVEALRQVALAMGDRPIIVRTLDVGGDKPLPYLPMPAEANPFLGVRALRLCFSRDDIFAGQLRAILRAGHDRDFKIMFPMVADVADLQRARASLEKAHDSLATENIPHRWPIETGIMIEIPSAALQAEALAEHADFFSIGTNDLTQYTLAADRGNPGVAAYQDTLHPAVLRLIARVVEGARTRSRVVAVCGEAASDELAALVLVGLGVEELSMTATRIPRIKAILRRQKSDALQQLARQCLDCTSAAEVRQLARELFSE